MKKIIVLALSLMMVISLAACGIITNNPSRGINTLPDQQETNAPDNTSESKTTFEIAEDYFNAGDYLKAYAEYSKVQYNEDDYEKAIQGKNASKAAYAQKINEELSSMNDESDLQNLLSRIEATTTVFEDNTLYAAKTNCEQKINDVKAKKQMQKDFDSLSSDLASKNYIQALDKLAISADAFFRNYGSRVDYLRCEGVNDSSTITIIYSGSEAVADCLNAYFKQYDGILADYCEQARAEAESYFEKNGDYVKAIQTLNRYLGYVDAFSEFSAAITNNTLYFGDTDVVNQIALYRTYIPALLTDIEPSRSTDISINSLGGWTGSKVDTKTYNQDTNGKAYDSTIMNDDSKGSVTYYVNFNYTTLEGIVYRPYYSISGNGDGDYQNGWVKIYGDGIVLYESPKITQKTYETYHFNIDISGVRELTIEMGGVWYPGWGHLATVGVADATISK